MNANLRDELSDALADFLEHAENAGIENDVYAGVHVDDAGGLLQMLEDGETFLPGDWIIARQVLEYRLNDLKDIARSNPHSDADDAYFAHEIAEVAKVLDLIASR